MSFEDKDHAIGATMPGMSSQGTNSPAELENEDIKKSWEEDQDPLEALLKQSQINNDYSMVHTRMVAKNLTYYKILTSRRPLFAFINRMLAFHCIQYTTSIYP